MKHVRWFSIPYIAWMVLFTVAPVFLVIYYAFTNAPDSSALTFAHLLKSFDWIYLKVLLRSLWLAVLCTVICLVIAYPIAMFLAKRPAGDLLSVLFILPMWMNFLLRTYAWMSLLENTGLINKLLGILGFGQVSLLYNTGAVLLGMVYNYLPFMILPLYTTLQKLDHSYVEAAQDLGANSVQVFLRVTLPLSRPGIVSGITMVFMPSVTTFVISKLLGGSQFLLYGDLIEQQFLQSGNWNFGAMLSFVMLVIMMASLAIRNKVNKKTGQGRSYL
jgi:spermidine/putrescine transport system permease protein